MRLHSSQSHGLGSAPPKQERMIIGFTCKVCSFRSYKAMSKQAYSKGVVIIKCDGCKSMHLIADHLGWFDSTKGPVGTIEDILKEKGEHVDRVAFDPSWSQLAASKASEDGENLNQNSEAMIEFLPALIEKLEKDV